MEFTTVSREKEPLKIPADGLRISGELSSEDYNKLKDGVDNKLTGFKISRNEAKTEEFSMDALISFAVAFLGNLVRQWQEMDINQKTRLQRLVLPNGLTYNKTAGSFGTAILSPGFKLLCTNSPKQSYFVAGAGIAPATSRL